MSAICKKSRVDAITDMWFNSPYHKTYNVNYDKDHSSRTQYYKLHILRKNQK